MERYKERMETHRRNKETWDNEQAAQVSTYKEELHATKFKRVGELNSFMKQAAAAGGGDAQYAFISVI